MVQPGRRRSTRLANNASRLQQSWSIEVVVVDDDYGEATERIQKQPQQHVVDSPVSGGWAWFHRNTPIKFTLKLIAASCLYCIVIGVVSVSSLFIGLEFVIGVPLKEAGNVAVNCAILWVSLAFLGHLAIAVSALAGHLLLSAASSVCNSLL